jgi:ribokinase
MIPLSLPSKLRVLPSLFRSGLGWRSSLASSGVAQITTAADGENVIVVVSGPNAHLLPSDLDKHLDIIRSAGIILTQLEIPLETVEHLATIAQRAGIPLVLDPAPAQPLPPSLLRLVEWLTPNESETCALLKLRAQEVPLDNLEDVAGMLLQCGSRNVLLKLGKRGSYLALADGRRIHVPAYEVSAIDTTAAGDAFNAAFASAFMEENDPLRSAYWVSAVAAISVTRPGAQPSMPSREEVEKFLEDSKDRLVRRL